MELGLEGKVALVTGSSRGIGRGKPGVCRARVAISCSPAATRRRSKESRRRSGAKDARLSSSRSIYAIRPRRKRWSRPRATGVRRPRHPRQQCRHTKRGDFFALTDADWEDGYALKFFAHVRLRAQPGRCSSSAAARWWRSAAPADASRRKGFTIGSSVNAAVAAFTKCLADLGKEDGVQVNCVHPSLVETERQWRRIRAEVERTGESEEKIREQFCRETGFTRYGKVEDVADFVTFIVRRARVAAWRNGRSRRRRRFRCCDDSFRPRASKCIFQEDALPVIPAMQRRRHEHPPHPGAHRFGRDPEPHRHAADDDADGEARATSPSDDGLLSGAGARRRRPHHHRDGLAGKGRPPSPPRVGIYDDRFLPGLTRLIEELHRAGSKASIQLGHGGGLTRIDICGETPIAPSAIPHRSTRRPSRPSFRRR